MSETTSNALLDALVSVVEESTTEANAIAERVGEANVNVAKSVKEARETSEDEQIVAYREWEEKAQAAIEAKRTAINQYILDSEIVKGSTLTEDETNALHEEWKGLAAKAKGAAKMITQNAEMLNLTVPELPALLTFKGKAKASGSGNATGTRRLRFDRVEVNGETVKSLSNVSQKIKSATGVSVTATELQAALFESAGTDDISKINDHSFQWTETVDNQTHTFDVTVYKAVNNEDEDAA